MKVERCPNYNHGRTNAPVRTCAMCGEVVNAEIPVKHCNEEHHARRRRNQDIFCSDCGERLRIER